VFSFDTQLTFHLLDHSGRLKFADARDLPSFPSSGLKKDGAAASAAAALGWANTKPVPLWTPDTSVAASAAALLASDGKMVSATPYRRTTAGSQAAALAIGSANAHRRQQSQSAPESASWGNSAAVLAFNNSMAPPPTNASPDLARQGSMRAAKGAMAGPRPRAKSTPTTKESYPDQANAASNALSAATIAHRPSMRSSDIPIEDAGAVPYTTMNRQMFTSRPPIKLEVDEKRHNDVIHASAVAMAKKMYSQQQTVINTKRADAHARSSSFSRHGSGSVADEDERPMGFGNLQEAAYKLAQQRLAKLQEEHQKTRGLQEYYGSPITPQHTKLGGIRNKITRRRSASDGALVEDKKRSMQIRKQMSLFDTKLAEVEEKKRTRDREALLAVAQRNVQARLRSMDERIQEETGWVAPPRDDWEWKARAAAQARFDASRVEDHRKVDLGGGKFMDREAVEAIAAKRVQPLLDEINENAERERERKALQKAEEEKQKEEAEVKKMRESEIQEIHKKIKGKHRRPRMPPIDCINPAVDQQKDQDKARKAEIKQEEKARKEDEKASRIEQKRMAKDEKQKGKEVLPPVDAPAVGIAQTQQTEKAVEVEPTFASNRHSRAISINFPKRLSKQKSKDFGDKSPILDDDHSHSPANKVKSWLKTHFPRPRSHSSPMAVTEGNKKKFIGGAALAKLTGRNDSPPSVDERGSASIREVAMAGKEGNDKSGSGKLDEPSEGSSSAVPNLNGVHIPSVEERRDDSTSLDTQSVSSLSSVDRFEEAQTTLSDVPVTPPKFVRAGDDTGRASPVRGSRFSELLE